MTCKKRVKGLICRNEYCDTTLSVPNRFGICESCQKLNDDMVEKEKNDEYKLEYFISEGEEWIESSLYGIHWKWKSAINYMKKRAIKSFYHDTEFGRFWLAFSVNRKIEEGSHICYIMSEHFPGLPHLFQTVTPLFDDEREKDIKYYRLSENYQYLDEDCMEHCIRLVMDNYKSLKENNCFANNT